MLVQAARLLGAALATICFAGAGVGIGTVVGALVWGTARNPSLKDELFGIAILGFALTKAIALFALMMAFMILSTILRLHVNDRNAITWLCSPQKVWRAKLYHTADTFSKQIRGKLVLMYLNLR